MRTITRPSVGRVVLGGLLAAVLVAGSAGPGGAQAPPSDPAPAPTVADEVAEQIAAIAADKAGRTPAERKVDSNLLYAAAEETGEPAVEGAPALESTAEVDRRGRTEVDITGTVDPALLDRIEDLGGEVRDSAPGFDAVRAELPVDAVVDLAADRRVRTIVPAGDATTNAEPAAGTSSVGAGTNEADVTHGADQVRATLGVDGTGVKACVLSDGVDTLAARQDSGDLPAVDILPGQEGSGDEGTAMLELIHDIAPGAELGFATAFDSQAGFAQNIIDLRADGCDVIVDDVTYFAEAAFQDDDVARAISQVRADGAVHFTSAGNSGNLADGTSGTWQGDFQDAGASASPLPTGLRVHGWGVNQPHNTLTSTTGARDRRVTLQWADPRRGGGHHYDLYALRSDGTAVVAASTTDQTGTQDPYEAFNGVAGDRLVVTRDAAAADRYLAVYTNRGRLEHATAGATYGHNASADAISTAAAPAAAALGSGQPVGPYPLQHSATDVSETFSSDGPVRSYYAPDGTPLTPGNLSSSGGVPRNGIDITAADGTTTTTPGFLRFFGTSAAAPNAGALAVLALSADPTLTPAELEGGLAASAIDVEAPGVDVTTGPGIVMAPALAGALGLADQALLVPGDRTVTEAAGDGDARHEPGEVFDVTQAVRNTGTQPATGTATSLTTTSPRATATLLTAAPATVAPGATASATYRVRIDRDCECGLTLPFTFTVTYAGGRHASRAIPFTLQVSGGAGTAATATYAGVPLAIPDNAPGVALSLPVSATGRVADVRVTLGGSACTSTYGATTVGIDHSYVGDLKITLTSPAGTTVTLADRSGGAGNNLCQTVFTDAGATRFSAAAAAAAPFTGSYRPQEALAAFAGEPAPGHWVLAVSDHGPDDTGSLRTFSVEVTPFTCDDLVDSAPTAAADAYDTAFDAPLAIAAPGVLGNDSDAELDVLTATLVDDVDDGTLALAADGSFTYTPDQGFSGEDTFTYTADGELPSSATTVTITVGADPNGAPTGVADTHATAYETVLPVAAPGVLGNDTDPEHDPLTAALVEDVEHGTLALNPDGSFIYIPDDGYSGPDDFTYAASDGKLASAATTVAITVGEKPNEAPAALDDSYTTPFHTEYVAAAPGVLANDTDVDGDALTATLVDEPDHGHVVLAPDGSFRYAPDGGYSGPDTFVYRAGDGELPSPPATVTITVGPRANAAPAAVADGYDVTFETARAVAWPGVLGNDADADGDDLAADLVDDVDHGALNLRSDGSFSYTPEDGFVGTDTFTYTASDRTLTSAPATVTLTVTRSTDAFVDALFRDFLGRPAEPAALAFWGDRLLGDLETRASAARKVSRSGEYAGIVTRRAYLTYLGRPGDAAGVAYWAERVRTGLSVTELPIHLLGSAEFLARSGRTPAAFVDALFASVLGRPPSAAERSERVAALSRGVSRATVARALHATVSSRQRRLEQQFLLLLDRAPTASERTLWVGRLATQDDRDLAVALAATDEYLARAQAP